MTNVKSLSQILDADIITLMEEKMEKIEFQIGDQIVYIPQHANGDVTNPDCEYGFVTSTTSTTVFCRFWQKGKPGYLRNLANSEGVSLSFDIRKSEDIVPQEVVFLHFLTDNLKNPWSFILMSEFLGL